jgi:hypothetical protein
MIENLKELKGEQMDMEKAISTIKDVDFENEKHHGEVSPFFY